MSEHVLIRQRGCVGHLTLNRPDALHALNEAMCASMLKALTEWAGDPSIHFVLIDHAEETRGFCAGGDVRMLARSGADDGREARAFFATEYRLNAAIHNFPKPYVALIDGVTMGGGVGISVHGSHRIATERTLFAMPETGIGLFPDVGGGWFLPRLSGELGTWLALTGARLKGSDVTTAGVATHFVPSDSIAALTAKLLEVEAADDAEQGINRLISSFGQDGPSASFDEYSDCLNACFSFDRAEDILAALEADASSWAAQQAEVLKTKSPRTVKVALRQLREGRMFKTFEENMRNEYRIAARQVASHDFLEGVRAVLIDKDHDPKWDPDSLAGIDEAVIDEVFAPLPADEELTFE